MAACSRAPSRSSRPCRSTRTVPSRRSPTGRSPIASAGWRRASPRWYGCARRRAMRAGSRSCCRTIRARPAAPATRSDSTCRRACWRCSRTCATPATRSGRRRRRRARSSMHWRAATKQRYRSRRMRACWRDFRRASLSASTRPGAPPEAGAGRLPLFYPFIVSNPGEAAQAKRRIAAVTIGHLPPPLVGTELSADARELERLVDEYAQADGLDRRRRERLARLIVETAQRSGLAREAGVIADVAPDEALRRIDAWLCDLKDLAIKDGLHVYGRGPIASVEAPPRVDARDSAYATSALCERDGLLAALDGRHLPPRPAGSPPRELRDVLPSGRHLFHSHART